MRRRGGAFKHGDDGGAHELPPLRSSAGIRTGGGKTPQAGPASPGEEEGGGLSSKVRTCNECGFKLCFCATSSPGILLYDVDSCSARTLDVYISDRQCLPSRATWELNQQT